MNINFSRMSKLLSIYKSYSSTTLLAFFLEQTTDRQIDLLFWVLRYASKCTGLELLPDLPLPTKKSYWLRPKNTSFSCFPIIYSSSIWKSFFLTDRSYLHHFQYLEGTWLNVIASLCWQPVATSFSYISWKYKYWCRFMWCCGTFACVAKM